jgi:hypothetical protein
MFENQKERFIKLESLREKYGFSKEQIVEFLGLDKVSSYDNKVSRKVSFTYEEMLILKAAFNKMAEKNGDNLLTMDDIFLD